MHHSLLSLERNPTLALLVLLGTALALRVLFFTGMANPTDLANLSSLAQIVTSLKSGVHGLGEALQEARATLGSFRNLALFAPSAAIFYALGVNAFSLHVLPVLASVVNVFFVYAITKAVSRDQSTAMLAGLLWVFFPLDIFYATASLRVVCVIFLFLLGLWSVTVAVLAERKWAYLVFVFAAALLFLWEPWLLAALLVITMHLYSHASSSYKWLPWAAMLGITGFLLVVGWDRTGAVFIDFYALLLAQGEMVFLLPLFLVALTVVVLERREQSVLPSIWVISLFLAFVGRGVSGGGSGEMNVFSAGTFLLALFVAFPVGIGNYFAKMLPTPRTNAYAAWLAGLGLLAAGLAVLGAGRFLPSLSGWDWIGLHSLFLIFSILGGVAFFAVMVSPLFLSGTTSKTKTSAAVILLLLILLAGLPFTWGHRNRYHYLYADVDGAFNYVSQIGSSLPVYVLEPQMETLSILLSQRQAAQNELVFGVSAYDEIYTGLILAHDDGRGVPANWTELGKFGELGWPRAVLYSLRAGDELGFTALLNQGELCESYVAWRETMQGRGSLRTMPYWTAPVDCLVLGESLVSILDLRMSSNIQDYLSFRPSEDDELWIYHPTLPVYDMRTITVNLPLEPNSLYLYSVEVRTVSPTAVLYWHWQGQEDYARLGSYPEWTTLSLLLMTPDWDEPQIVSFSPVLFDHLDDVMVRNFYIGKADFQK